MAVSIKRSKDSTTAAGKSALPAAHTGKSMQEVEEMKNKPEKYVCALCGYTADGRFVGDICPNCGLTYWKCEKCGFLITAAKPPDVCPECGERCDFIDVSCYIPECGGPGHVDRRL